MIAHFHVTGYTGFLDILVGMKAVIVVPFDFVRP